MEHIDVIFYINLEHRTDRRAHIEKQLGYICDDPTKIVRIDGIKRTPGILGCTLSHMKAYVTFLANPAWKTCLIFEDDFTFHVQDREANNARLRKVCEYFPNWDVIQFSFNPMNFLGKVTDLPDVIKVISAQTASGYCITRDFAYKLYDNLSMAAKLLEEYGAHGFCSNDISWKVLQPEANWFTLIPVLGYQIESYSDIQNEHVNYGC